MEQYFHNNFITTYETIYGTILSQLMNHTSTHFHKLHRKIYFNKLLIRLHHNKLSDRLVIHSSSHLITTSTHHILHHNFNSSHTSFTIYETILHHILITIMSDILWQTFNNTYTNSIRNSSFNNYSDKVSFNSSFNNYSDKVSFNNYSDKHFWKMIYNILIKILQYIHSNYERYMMNKFHIHFTTFTSQHSSKSGDDSSTNFQHIMHHINWVTDISSNLSQIFRNKLSDRYFIKSSSWQVSDKLVTN